VISLLDTVHGVDMRMMMRMIMRLSLSRNEKDVYFFARGRR
jgi:hypothetical protein